MNQSKKKILFYSAHNACRSVMAQAWANHFYKDKYDFYRGGIAHEAIDKRAQKVLKEIGVDVIENDLHEQNFDLVFILSNEVNYPLEAKIVKLDFDDPNTLISNLSDEEKRLSHFRRVRDEIKALGENIENYL